MAAKKYECKIELTTRPQTDGKRLTFYPGQELEAKVLHKDQIERFLAKGVIEEKKKASTRTRTTVDDISVEKVEDVDGS